MNQKDYCSVCYGENLKTVHQITRSERGKRDLYHFSYRVMSCQDCGLLQNKPNNRKILQKFYTDSLSEVVGTRISQDALKNYQSDIREIKKANPETQTLAEIGCSDGNFLLAAAKNKLHVIGIEPSREYAELAQKKSGRRVFHGNFDQWCARGEKVDVLVGYYVFEHMFDPHDFLRKCFEHLNPNGVLFLEIPILERFTPKLAENLFLFQHPFHYSVRSAARLLQGYFQDVQVFKKSFGTEFGAKFLCKKSIEYIDDVRLAKKYLREQQTKDKLTKNELGRLLKTSRQVILFGGGATAKKILSFLSVKEKERIVAVADNDTRKSGLLIDGIRVDIPERVFKKRKNALVIACLDYSPYIQEARKQCKELGVSLTLLSTA